MTLPLALFEGVGIELEYMIVDSETLAVRPLADELLKQVGGGYEMEVELGEVAWSNELALHVVEIKTNGPRASLRGLDVAFQEHVTRINQLLDPMGARLLPTAMHPFMDPATELRLWPHENNVIYKTFDRIFGCTGHGWANLQSMHINLPFADDAEFAKLHAAIRLVLPILPALAASSPYVEGRRTPFLDTRLDFYRTNSIKVPSVTGQVIPERVFSKRAYEGQLLQEIYADLEPHDPEGILQHEWVNARGAIARFDRNAIEIRLIDLQECPVADISIAAAVVAALRALVDQTWCSTEDQQTFDELELSGILDRVVLFADDAELDHDGFLRAFGYVKPGPVRARELWQHIVEHSFGADPVLSSFRSGLDVILEEGCLARRLVAAAGLNPGRAELSRVYRALADCLLRGLLFRPRK